ncbi:MAG: hypothetical protein B7Z71_12985 [Acidocella sp. 21-58-7]|nr:MAG: hypothetical protein B7Z71_12985 [Acidocella sp. 21-58-7]
MDDESVSGDGVGDAARAFEDLRAEVSVMRRAVEALPGAMADSLPPAPPDYRSDVGKVAQMLAAVVGRLDVIEQHPALKETPESYAAQIENAGTSVFTEPKLELGRAITETRTTSRELADMIGNMRGKVEQREWVVFWVATVGLGAMLLGLIASPFIASHLPFGWDGTVASIVMDQPDRWDTGWALLRAAKPGDATNASTGYNLVQANQAALVACQQAAANERKDQKCPIIVKAQSDINSGNKIQH